MNVLCIGLLGLAGCVVETPARTTTTYVTPAPTTTYVTPAPAWPIRPRHMCPHQQRCIARRLALIRSGRPGMRDYLILIILVSVAGRSSTRPPKETPPASQTSPMPLPTDPKSLLHVP